MLLIPKVMQDGLSAKICCRSICTTKGPAISRSMPEAIPIPISVGPWFFSKRLHGTPGSPSPVKAMDAPPDLKVSEEPRFPALLVNEKESVESAKAGTTEESPTIKLGTTNLPKRFTEILPSLGSS